MDSIRVVPEHQTEPCCFREGGSVVFCGYFSSRRGRGAVFYDAQGGDPRRVLFPEEAGVGRLVSVRIEGLPEGCTRYRLLDGDREVPDPFAHRVFGLEQMDHRPLEGEIFGEVLPAPPKAWGVGVRAEEGPRGPEEDFLYLLHVRGFTMSPTAGIPRRHRGTYAGVIDKLDHIKSLGVTAVEVMPAYELVSAEYAEDAGTISVLSGIEPSRERINYWGFKEGYYFAPRSAYAQEDPRGEFLEMVQALHGAGIGVILQFWFPQDYPMVLICQILRHWAGCYGVDGFHLVGGGLCVETIVSDPALAGTRIYYDSLAFCGPSRGRAMRAEGFSLYRDDFRRSIRRFLKGDDRSVGAFFGAMIRREAGGGIVNYLANYEGMRLNDSVCYEHKHNEGNHENNADGASDNMTWNCGVEGRSRRVGVMRLRRRQIFNQLVMLFFAQGTPMLCAGDEILHTQDGNNNPYCQDNPVSWVNWKNEHTVGGGSTLSFIRFLVGYRREHRILRQPEALRLMDYKAYGFPDLSAHGQEAWKPDFSDSSHSIGMLYCCLYAKEQDPAFLYCIYNCHWERRAFALPTVPKPLRWTVVIDTWRQGEETRPYRPESHKSVTVEARSVMVLEARGSFQLNGREERSPF